MDAAKYGNIVNGFRVTLAEEGFRALGKGWAPTFIGYSMQGVGKFGFYEAFKILYAGMLGEVGGQFASAVVSEEWIFWGFLFVCLFFGGLFVFCLGGGCCLGGEGFLFMEFLFCWFGSLKNREGMILLSLSMLTLFGID